MGMCTHNGACLRVMGLLCFGERDYSKGWGADAQKARENAARWMGCAFCEEYDTTL